MWLPALALAHASCMAADHNVTLHPFHTALWPGVQNAGDPPDSALPVLPANNPNALARVRVPVIQYARSHLSTALAIDTARRAAGF